MSNIVVAMSTPEITLQPEPQTAAIGPSARLTRALKQGLLDAWDKLGLVVGMSLTGTLVVLLALSFERLVPRSLPFIVHLGVVMGTITLLLPLPLAGSFHIAHLIATRDEISYLTFWQTGLHLYRKALALLATDFLVLGGLGINLWFYTRFGNLLGLCALLLCIYLLLFWCLMAQYHFPLLIAQEAGVFDTPDIRARRGTFAIVRRSFFLTLGRPFYAVGLLVIVLPLLVVCVLSGVLLALIGFGLLALLLTHSTRALLLQFGVIPPPPPPEEVIPDLKFRIKGV